MRVRYAETDKMGVVYHANYFVWFEVARTDWLRETGWTYREMELEGVGLPVLEAHCVYRQPARYDDELDVRATLRHGGGLEAIADILLRAVHHKPTGHRLDLGQSTEAREMFQIGG